MNVIFEFPVLILSKINVLNFLTIFYENLQDRALLGVVSGPCAVTQRCAALATSGEIFENLFIFSNNTILLLPSCKFSSKLIENCARN